MRFPDIAYADVVALYERHRGLAEGNDDQRRELTRMMAEQIHFDLGPSWGTKSASPDRPPSKDAIAFQVGNGPTLFGYDWQDGNTRKPHPQGDMKDITGQTFLHVLPINHLGGTPTPEPEPPPGGDVIPYDEQKSIEFGHACNQVYRETPQPIDAGMISVHSQRAAWDYYVGGLEWPESLQKHVNEFRAVYGLPPV